MPDHFRLEHIQEEFNFATDEEMDNSKRFRLILLRDQGVEGFRQVVIPAYDREISDNVFTVNMILVLLAVVIFSFRRWRHLSNLQCRSVCYLFSMFQ